MKTSSSKNDISLRAIALAWKARFVRAARRKTGVSGDGAFAWFYQVSSVNAMSWAAFGGAMGAGVSYFCAMGAIASPPWPWFGLWIAPMVASGVAVARWGLSGAKVGSPGMFSAATAGLWSFCKKMTVFFDDGDPLWQASNKDWAAGAKLVCRPWIGAAFFTALGLVSLGMATGFVFLTVLTLPRAVREIGRVARERALKTAQEWTKEGRSVPEFASDEKRQLDEALPKAMKKVEQSSRL